LIHRLRFEKHPPITCSCLKTTRDHARAQALTILL
jgi:hypothetical protein